MTLLVVISYRMIRYPPNYTSYKMISILSLKTFIAFMTITTKYLLSINILKKLILKNIPYI